MISCVVRAFSSRRTVSRATLPGFRELNIQPKAIEEVKGFAHRLRAAHTEGSLLRADPGPRFSAD